MERHVAGSEESEFGREDLFKECGVGDLRVGSGGGGGMGQFEGGDLEEILGKRG